MKEVDCDLKKNNILIIVADQLTWNALPAYGNTYVKTPNIDRICENSVKFDSCYTPCPLCQPARAAFWSSKHCHDIDVRSNGRRWPVKPVGEEIPTLGETFYNAGYDTVHFGKTHDAGALHGFKVVTSEREFRENDSPGLPLNGDTYEDVTTRKNVVDYLENYDGNKPFLVVADLLNPHNICGWVGEFQGTKENPWLTENLPPLPENFCVEDMENRPKAVQYICCSHNRQAQASEWTDLKFRQYLYAYYYYITLLDQEVGKILDALEDSKAADNTMIVFLSDHGDSMGARRRVTKQVDFYEEVTRVPFVFSGPGVLGRKETVKGLTSLLDLFPTLCGLAGLPIPEGLRGMDLSHVISGDDNVIREYVASEWHTEWGYTVSPGRMIRTDRYKYIRYLENNECELYDLTVDPKEKKNLIGNPLYASVHEEMEAVLKKHIAETEDDFEQLEVMVDLKYRSHTPGYHIHRGLAAPQDMERESQKQQQAFFDAITKYVNQGDNRKDNLRRAEVMGFGNRNVRIAPGAVVRVRDRQKIGSNIHIGLYNYINGDVTIENDVLIGPHCSVAAGNHKFDPETGWFSARTEGDGDESIVIGQGSWLASGVTVTAGVKIGKKNLICANSVVTKSTADYAIMAGTPAKQIGRIEPETGEYIWLDNNLER